MITQPHDMKFICLCNKGEITKGTMESRAWPSRFAVILSHKILWRGLGGGS